MPAVWLILALTLRRGLAYPNVLAWLVSGLRCIGARLPRRLVKDGAITHARRRIGVDVLRDLFCWTRRQALELGADIHGWVSVIIDGSQLTMPDTAVNCIHWGKPGASRGMAAFAQLRLVALVSAATQAVLEVELAPCRGEGTGEKTLAADLVGKTVWSKNSSSLTMVILEEPAEPLSAVDGSAATPAPEPPPSPCSSGAPNDLSCDDYAACD